MTKYKWTLRRKKTEEQLPDAPPVWLGNHSNGEFFAEQTPKERRMHDMIMQRAGEQARRLGIERREFLASSMGMMTTLAVFNQMGGCGDDGLPMDGKDIDGGLDAGTSNNPLSDPYVVPPEATCEDTDLLQGDEFIFDVQTHSFDDGEWRTTNPAYANFLMSFARCGEGLDCFDAEHYARAMFVDSDTTMTVITSWPSPLCTEDRQHACGLLLSNEGMRDLRDYINDKSRSQRCINQVQVMPNDRLPLQKENMTEAREAMGWSCGSWKAYPAWASDTYQPEGKPAGYYLTDDLGLEFIEHGLSLGVPNFAVHKGLQMPGFDVDHNHPRDVGPVARMFPKANFVIYHSAISAGGASGGAELERMPFDPNADPATERGLDTLIRTLLAEDLITEDGVGDKKLNVYAELGTVWGRVMNDAIASQHFMGKLLKYLGEDNIVWGTDSILTGSPQFLIDAMRRFQISPEFQEMYGYPAMTQERKLKVFGLNAARIYRVDPEAKRCAVTADQFALMKQHDDAVHGPRRWSFQQPLAPRTRREFMQLARMKIAKNNPA